MTHESQAVALVGWLPRVSRSGSAFLLVALFALAAPAHATFWEIRITAPAYAYASGTWGPLGNRTAIYSFDPAELSDPCCPPGPDACCFEGGPFGYSFSPRTVIGGTILHYSILTPSFVFNPYDLSQDGGATISGGEDGWSWAYYDPAGPSDFYVGNITVSQVPESGTLALLGLGLAGMALSRRRKA